MSEPKDEYNNQTTEVEFEIQDNNGDTSADELRQKAGDFMKAASGLAGSFGKFAIKKGSELRDKIEDEEFQKKAKENIKGIKSKATEKATRVVDRATEFTESKTKDIDKYVASKEEIHFVEETQGESIKSTKTVKIGATCNEPTQKSKEKRTSRDVAKVKASASEKKSNKTLFAIIGVAILVIFGLFVLMGRGNSHEGQIKPPSGDMKGKNYKEVVEKFEEAGFTNVSTEKIEDLVLGFLTSDGDVEEVRIDDEPCDVDKWYDSGAKVVVVYHTFPLEEVQEKEDVDTVSESTAEAEEEKKGSDIGETPVDPEIKEKLESFVGEHVFDVFDSIEQTGYTPKFEAAYTFEDMTSSLKSEMNEGYYDNEWIIVNMKDIDPVSKTATYVVTSKWQRENLF